MSVRSDWTTCPWRNGYETTTLNDLTQAMGVTAPSIYATFGDKRQLFLEAVQRYAGTDVQREQAISGAKSSYAAAQQLLDGAIAVFTCEDTSAGCMLASSTATGSEAAADVRLAVAKIRNDGRSTLRRRIEQDVRQGVLPHDVDTEGLADFVFAVAQGPSTLARDGVSRAQLNAVARHALVSWPIGNRAS